MNFGRLDKSDRRLVRQLAGILRVAEGLDRTHGQVVRSMRLAVHEEGVRVAVEAETNPEVDIADGLRKGALFEKVFGVELAIVWARRRSRAAAGRRRRPARATETEAE